MRRWGPRRPYLQRKRRPERCLKLSHLRASGRAGGRVRLARVRIQQPKKVRTKVP